MGFQTSMANLLPVDQCILMIILIMTLRALLTIVKYSEFMISMCGWHDACELSNTCKISTFLYTKQI